MRFLRSGVLILASGLALCLLWEREAGGVFSPAEARRDARRFGLNRLERRQRRLPEERAQRAFAEFNRRQGGLWTLRLSPRTGRPEAVVGGSTRRFPGGPRAAAASFLAETGQVLGLEPEDLAVLKESAGRGHSHLLYQQTYRGLPVEFARVKVHLDAQGSVMGVHSSFEPELRLGTEPSLPVSQAAEVVRRDLGIPPTSEGSLVIFPSERSGRAHLAWKFTAGGAGGLWRYYVDAHTGELLFRYNDLRFQAPVCLTSGTVRGLVYDVDPSATPGPAEQPFNHLRVYVAGPSTFAVTGVLGPGFYCSQTPGKVFSQLQGPFVNVSNFRGPSAHFDNGGLWATVATPLSSPHPYPNNANLVSTIDLSALAPTAVKFLPVFTSLNVGSVLAGSQGETLDIADDDEVTLLDPSGFPIASYFGNRGAFSGTAVPGTLLRIRLKSNASGTLHGYDVSLSSYLALTSPTVPGPSGSFTWNPALHASLALRGEISLFYHLNLMHDYFMSDVNKSSSAFIGNPVNAVAFAGPGLVNPFYNPEFDNLFFGEVSEALPSDLITDDATVTHHEYTHYVVEKLWPIQNFGQAGAISEAVADYFSASSLSTGTAQHTSIGKYLNEGLGGTGALRELDCPSKGPCQALTPSNWAGEIHEDSIYLSQALWDIRKDRVALQGSGAGRSCADGLVFQSLLFFPESFQEFMDAIKRVDALGAVPACGIGACGGVAAGCVAAAITAKFSAHGLNSVGGTSDPYDTASARNDGFESAADLSSLSGVSATIFPAGDLDFYALGAGPGPIRITLRLPPDGFFFKGYGMTLYDRDRKIVAAAAPAFNGINTDQGACEVSDCTTTASQASLLYDNPGPGLFFLQVAGGPTVSGGSNSGVNSTVPYSLALDYVKPGAVPASIVSASFDSDTISYSARVTTFPRTQDYSFGYAQLRDQALWALPQTDTRFPGFLTLVSSANALGTVSGRLRLVPGFAARFPAVGTVHLEVFAYNVAGSTISLGLSNPLNLTAGRAELTAWNNVFNPLRGEKATVKYEVSSPGRVTLRLYTLSGAHVLTLFDDEVPAGKGSVDWTGRNLSGHAVASGVYLLHMNGPGISKTQKIAVVK